LTALGTIWLILISAPKAILDSRTPRDEIAWRCDLLTAAEQALFRRLAVFEGGFTLEAAQAVGDADGGLGIPVLDGIATLVDHNLLKRMEQSDGERCFGILEQSVRTGRVAKGLLLGLGALRQRR
jgi:hypothetical protein